MADYPVSRPRRARIGKPPARENSSAAAVAHHRFLCSARWRTLRAARLAAEPLCRHCKAQGRLTPATEVDHITPATEDPDRALDADNLQSLCKPCHSAKTAADTRRRGVRGDRG